jgi:hypothetical protein
MGDTSTVAVHKTCRKRAGGCHHTLVSVSRYLQPKGATFDMCVFALFSVSPTADCHAFRGCRWLWIMALHRRLSVAECLKRAEQCRDFARRAKAAEHSIMLKGMAETWERIADDVRQSQYELLRLPISKNKSNPRILH